MINFVQREYILKEEANVLALAKMLVLALQEKNINSLVIFLKGDLGAGKTTFTRGFLNGLAFNGTVKSPTYTLVEPYELQGQQLYHMDLYRLQDEVALEEMGIAEYFQEEAYFLIEWPLENSRILPQPDWVICFHMMAKGRKLNIQAMSEKGNVALQNI
ncbi:tRNA (adenosine(37)-N6)-threonylcarbamoyltransferase complex ATPase subunit type 1 TsaE [Candidatus Berkiella cookevillensis]|uniref:tRNA threonylcarbamoyladenosine biosynthesis protein TsaE n=1 Tax=Candidatus Berkiella cookevillensis TaxID=437022 RepID=A0A0Q9YG70_9GAMM|nr:tRNA (adenosine(37)-N6)-threonylcarbamoyltransferase complex ATPase subunit type 1 TsaE [Candidatus Berkiella cookevillensis]MCS5707546.1 tRNA (adenosine(37)-N6)-threonylcarbamoyltransferase complex ATPase subunit type 1 TsaE [Candidatus Berkiella cookevillensis]